MKKNSFTIAFLLALPLILCNCSRQKDPAGVYTGTMESYIELKADSTFLAKQIETDSATFRVSGNNQTLLSFTGTAIVEDQKITFVLSGGHVFEAQRLGDTISFGSSGDNRWIRWEGGTTSADYEQQLQKNEDKYHIKKSIRDHQQIIMNELTTLCQDIVQYKHRPTNEGGGGGSYLGYALNADGMWGTSNENAMYTIAELTKTKFKIVASSKVYTGATIDVTCDEEGKPLDGPNAKGW